MLPSPSDLHYFLELYETKNISRAAERLGITQPSLSLSLKRLEEVLNVQLFMRSKAGAFPTKEADLLAKDVEDLLNDWTRLGNKAKEAMGSIKGNIKIGCHASVSLYAVKPWIKKLFNQYPQLEISFQHDLSRKVLEQIISFKLDMAFVINPIQHPDLVILPLVKDTVTLRKAKNKKVDTKTLIYDPNLTQTQALLLELKKRNLVFKRHVTTESLELIENLTSLGLGVGILPERVCKSPMLEFNTQIKAFKDQLTLVYRVDITKTKSFSVTLDAIKQSFKY